MKYKKRKLILLRAESSSEQSTAMIGLCGRNQLANFPRDVLLR